MHSVAHLIHAYGLIVVAGFIGLESICIPLPGETALIVSAAIAGHTHELNIVAVILTAIGASLIGRMIGYAIGARFGYWLLLRYGGYVWITEARIKLGQYLFLRHGGKIIIIAQFLPVMRAIAGVIAGANRMPWRQFVVASTAGIVVWATVFGVAAYSLGRQFARATSWLDLNDWVSWPWLIVVCCAVIYVLFRYVGHHEAQWTARAERALPGPLQLP
jgi:membrane protein DedA with SNARE-associated domain